MFRSSIGGMFFQGVAVVSLLVATSSVIGCAGEPTETAEQEQAGAEPKSFENVAIPLDSGTAGSNSTAIVNGLTFAVPSSVLAENASPAALAAALMANPTTEISFSNVANASGDFSMTNPTLSGKLKIASCTFTVSAPASLAGTIFIKSCAVKVTAAGVAPGGGDVAGSATLELNGVSSAPVTIQVSLSPSGAIVVNGHPTAQVITGTTGG